MADLPDFDMTLSFPPEGVVPDGQCYEVRVEGKSIGHIWAVRKVLGARIPGKKYPGAVTTAKKLQWRARPSVDESVRYMTRVDAVEALWAEKLRNRWSLRNLFGLRNR